MKRKYIQQLVSKTVASQATDSISVNCVGTSTATTALAGGKELRSFPILRPPGGGGGVRNSHLKRYVFGSPCLMAGEDTVIAMGKQRVATGIKRNRLQSCNKNQDNIRSAR
jgi:hypothetical protein